MAGLKFIAQTEYESLASATPKTVLQLIAPTNQRVKLLGWSVGFDGTAIAEAIEAIVGVGTVAGTFTDTLGALDTHGSVTIVGEIDGTIQSVAKCTPTAEPTYVGVYDAITVSPTGNYSVEFDEPLIINGGDFIGIEITSPATAGVRAKLICEE